MSAPYNTELQSAVYRLDTLNAELLAALQRIADSEPRPFKDGSYDASVVQDLQRAARAAITKAVQS